MQRGSELQQQQQQQQEGYFKLSIACKACARNQRRLFEAGTREKTISYIIAHRFNGILMANSYPVKYLSTARPVINKQLMTFDE